MEWKDCRKMARTELADIVNKHLSLDPKNRAVLYGEDGTSGVVKHINLSGAVWHSPVKYLLTYVHKNADAIRQYAEAVRPLYSEILGELDARMLVSGLTVTVNPPKDKAEIKYRRYVYLDTGGNPTISVANRACVGPERRPGFVKWLDDDWITEEVEL